MRSVLPRPSWTILPASQHEACWIRPVLVLYKGSLVCLIVLSGALARAGCDACI